MSLTSFSDGIRSSNGCIHAAAWCLARRRHKGADRDPDGTAHLRTNRA